MGILYVVYDKSKKTLSQPLIGPSLEVATDSLNLLNPENLSDLIIHPILTLNSNLDLFLLSIDPTKSLPDFIIDKSGEVTSSPTQQPTGASS